MFTNLKTVAVFSFFTNYVKNRVNQFSTFGVVSLCPVIASATLTEYKIVWSENPSIRSRTDWVHSAWLQVNQNSTRNILSTYTMHSISMSNFKMNWKNNLVWLTWGFIVVNVDPLELETAVTDVLSFGVYAMFIGNDLPELNTKWQIYNQAL